jgi:hypothetical protein
MTHRSRILNDRHVSTLTGPRYPRFPVDKPDPRGVR